MAAITFLMISSMLVLLSTFNVNVNVEFRVPSGEIVTCNNPMSCMNIMLDYPSITLNSRVCPDGCKDLDRYNVVMIACIVTCTILNVVCRFRYNRTHETVIMSTAYIIYTVSCIVYMVYHSHVSITLIIFMSLNTVAILSCIAVHHLDDDREWVKILITGIIAASIITLNGGTYDITQRELQCKVSIGNNKMCTGLWECSDQLCSLATGTRFSSELNCVPYDNGLWMARIIYFCPLLAITTVAAGVSYYMPSIQRILCGHLFLTFIVCTISIVTSNVRGPCHSLYVAGMASSFIAICMFYIFYSKRDEYEDIDTENEDDLPPP